jgi:hypothetical protein
MTTMTEVATALREEALSASAAGTNAMLALYEHAGQHAETLGLLDHDLSSDGGAYQQLKSTFSTDLASKVSEVAKMMKPVVRQNYVAMLATADDMIATTASTAPPQQRNRQKVVLKLATKTIEGNAWSGAVRDAVIKERSEAESNAADPKHKFDKGRKGAIRALNGMAGLPGLPAETKASLDAVRLTLTGLAVPDFVPIAPPVAVPPVASPDAPQVTPEQLQAALAFLQSQQVA